VLWKNTSRRNPAGVRQPLRQYSSSSHESIFVRTITATDASLPQNLNYFLKLINYNVILIFTKLSFCIYHSIPLDDSLMDNFTMLCDTASVTVVAIIFYSTSTVYSKVYLGLSLISNLNPCSNIIKPNPNYYL
jgi:hypothetical protein